MILISPPARLGFAGKLQNSGYVTGDPLNSHGLLDVDPLHRDAGLKV
jgi:hypothetical protein